MMDDSVLNYLFLFILLEMYEVYWQKAQTVMGMLARMYQHYSKNIFLFFIMHPTFYFSIWFFMLCEYNVYAMILMVIKALDIVIKIILIQQVFIKKELSEDLVQALLAPINEFFPYIGLLIYPPLIILALQ